MLKKTVTYKNFLDEEVTEDLYFHFSKAELAEMQLGSEEGLSNHLEGIIKAKDGSAIMSTFRMLLGKAIGRRSEDGRRFEKSEEIKNDFLYSGAYDEVFMELVTNADAAVEFIKGAIPSELIPKIDETKIKSISMDKVDLPGTSVEVVKKLEDYTDQELRDMSQSDFEALVGTDPRKMSRGILEIAMYRKMK